MTKEQIIAMEAGRELDKLVAEQIFSKKVVSVKYLEGWMLGTEPDEYDRAIYESCYATTYEGGETYLFGSFDEREMSIKVDLLEQYSTDISVAWRVVDRLFEDGFREQRLVRDHRTGTWEAEFGINEAAFAESMNLPEAICKAALLTKHYDTFLKTTNPIERMGIG